MLLERVDIDVYGRHRHAHLGPFSERLNVVFGPPGAGKTELVECLRGVMLGSGRWPAGSAARLLWADNDGLIRCRREPDGTHHGGISVEYLGRDGGSLPDSEAWSTERRLRATDPALFEAVIAASGSAGVQADRALAAARAAGLTVEGMPPESPDAARLRRRIDQLDDEIAGLSVGRQEESRLQNRRRELLRQIDAFRAAAPPAQGAASDRRRLDDRWAMARMEAERLGRQEEQLRREIRELETRLDGLAEPAAEARQGIDPTQRRRLERLDAQLLRCRRALRDVRGLRDRFRQAAAELSVAMRDNPQPAGPRERRENEALQSTEQRLLEAQARALWLADRHAEQQEPGHADECIAAWLATLADDVRQVHGALAHGPALETVRRDLEMLAARRGGEQEVIDATERLVAERAAVLREIAAALGVPYDEICSTFGNWCHGDQRPEVHQGLDNAWGAPPQGDRRAEFERGGRLRAELADRRAALGRATAQRETACHEVDRWRRELDRSAEVATDFAAREAQAALREELEALEQRLDARRVLERQRGELARQLHALHRSAPAHGDVAVEAGRWLDRLSAGRLRSVQFGRHGHVEVDGRGVSELAPGDAALAATAVRMAVANALARDGRLLPLVLDEPLRGDVAVGPLADTLQQYAAAGHQLIVLTGNPQLTDRIAAAGGRVMRLAAAHPASLNHRPDVAQINRALDSAWRDIGGGYEEPDLHPREATAASPPSLASLSENHSLDYRPRPSRRETARRFFLTDDSPIHEAPSIDAVAAMRLRGMGIQRIGQLLAADAENTADRIALSGVTPREVRRWQAEARLVCRVPQLRAFDARVLAGCGVTTPHRLAEIEPAQLLRRVRRFLATDRGRQILRSGTSYELARITCWIVSGDDALATAGATSGGAATRDRRTTAASLNAESPIGDAPSIDPEMAEWLEQIDILTVDDLLVADPETVAEQLDHPEVDAETVHDWHRRAVRASWTRPAPRRQRQAA